MARIVIHISLFLSFFQMSLSAQSPMWTSHVSYYTRRGAYIQLPNNPTCGFVSNGAMRLVAAPSVPVADFYTHFETGEKIPVTDNFSVEMRVRNNAAIGGIDGFDVVFDMLTGTDKTSCAMMGAAWAQPYTYLSAQGNYIGNNFPFLVQNFTNWRVFKIRCNNKRMEFSLDNTILYSTTYIKTICQIDSLKIRLKGQGAVDWVRVTNEENQTQIYFDDFTNCNALRLPLKTPPSVLATINAPCEGDSLKLETKTRAVAYEWTGPNGFISTLPNPTIPKTNRLFDGALFSLKAQINACQMADTTLRVRLRESPIVDLGRDTFGCSEGEALVLDAKNIGSSYLWQNGLNNRFFNVLRSGDYSVTVTNTEGCKASASVKVEVAPSPIVHNVGVVPPKCYNICNADAFTEPTGGFGPPYSIYWTGGETRKRIIGLCQGTTLTLEVRDARGCVSEKIVNIPKLKRVVASAEPDTVYHGFALSCAGSENGKAMAKGSGGVGNFSFKWLTKPEQTTRIAENLKADTLYKVVVADKNGCRDTAEVQLKAPMPIEADFDMKNIRCGGEKSGALEFLNATGGTGQYDLILNNKVYSAQKPRAFEKLSAGVYNVILRDSNGCSIEKKFELTEPPKLNLITSPDTIVTLGDEFTLFAGADTPSVSANILWFSEGDSTRRLCSDCDEIREIANKPTRFKVRVIDTSGCIAERMITVRVDKKRRLFVPNIFSPNGDGINDVLLISAGRGVRMIKGFKVFNRWGGLVHERYNFQPDDTSHGWDGQMNNGAADAATFIWTLDAEFDDGERLLLTGDVTVSY